MSSTESLQQTVRDNRSSENNFTVLLQVLEKGLASAEAAGNHVLAKDLQEVKEKYATAYQKATETGGNSWPEFEKFVTELERALMNAKKKDVSSAP